MFTDPKPLGYAFGERLPSADVNTVWHQLPFALDTRGGDTYTPTAAITIAGLFGINLRTLVIPLNGSADFCDGSVIINSSGFAVGGGVPSSFAGVATFTAGVLLQSDVTMSGAGNKFIFGSTADRPEFQNGILQSAGNNDFAGDTSHLGEFEMSVGDMIMTGFAGLRPRPTYIIAADANLTIGTKSGGTGNAGADAVKLPSGVLSTGRDATITSTNASSGSRLIVSTKEPTHALQLRQDNGTAICALKSGTGTAPPPAGFFAWVELESNGSANGWSVLRGWAA